MNNAWMSAALCREIGGDHHYQADNHPANYTTARTICARCPVTTQCLTHALATRELQWGMWGGMSPRERQTLARSQP